MAENIKPPARDFKVDVLYFIAAVFAVLLIRDFIVGDASTLR